MYEVGKIQHLRNYRRLKASGSVRGSFAEPLYCVINMQTATCFPLKFKSRNSKLINLEVYSQLGIKNVNSLCLIKLHHKNTSGRSRPSVFPSEYDFVSATKMFLGFP